MPWRRIAKLAAFVVVCTATFGIARAIIGYTRYRSGPLTNWEGFLLAAVLLGVAAALIVLGAIGFAWMINFSRWPRFGLRALFIATTLIAFFLGGLTYYRPNTIDTQWRCAVVAASAVGDKWNRAISVKGESRRALKKSPYKWIVLDDEELRDLLVLDDKASPIILDQTHRVWSWPYTAMTATGTATHRIPQSEDQGEYIYFESSHLYGGVGTRVAGIQQQLRIECTTAYYIGNGNEGPIWLKEHTAGNYHRISGLLAYRGALPRKHLVFLAPIDEDAYHVVIFDAKTATEK